LQPVSGACVGVLDAERVGIVLSEYAVKEKRYLSALRPTNWASLVAVKITE